MKSLYIIPKKDNIEESLRLSREYGAYFEYNDFFLLFNFTMKLLSLQVIEGLFLFTELLIRSLTYYS